MSDPAAPHDAGRAKSPAPVYPTHSTTRAAHPAGPRPDHPKAPVPHAKHVAARHWPAPRTAPDRDGATDPRSSRPPHGAAFRDAATAPRPSAAHNAPARAVRGAIAAEAVRSYCPDDAMSSPPDDGPRRDPAGPVLVPHDPALSPASGDARPPHRQYRRQDRASGPAQDDAAAYGHPVTTLAGGGAHHSGFRKPDCGEACWMGAGS